MYLRHFFDGFREYEVNKTWKSFDEPWNQKEDWSEQKSNPYSRFYCVRADSDSIPSCFWLQMSSNIYSNLARQILINHLCCQWSSCYRYRRM